MKLETGDETKNNEKKSTTTIMLKNLDRCSEEDGDSNGGRNRNSM
jgi:hypothetical protein